MYTWIWIALALGLIIAGFSLYFLMKDAAYGKQLKKKRLLFLLPDWLLLLVSIGWIGNAVYLYLAIQSQLNVG